MSNFNYDTYCGLYCGSCSILMAYKTGHKDRFADYWTEDNVKAFLQGQGVTISDNESLQQKCHGCKSDTVFINCRACKIRKCAINRKIEHCTDCDDYPCDLSKEFQNYKNILPHLKIVPNNLLTIKDVGAKQWLEEQEKKWKCPECQTSFTWYTTNCPTCGKNLEIIKDRL